MIGSSTQRTRCVVGSVGTVGGLVNGANGVNGSTGPTGPTGQSGGWSTGPTGRSGDWSTGRAFHFPDNSHSFSMERVKKTTLRNLSDTIGPLDPPLEAQCRLWPPRGYRGDLLARYTDSLHASA